MSAIGIVFLYDRSNGPPEEISKQFGGEGFSKITENLVKQNLLNIAEVKEILDSKMVFWAGIKENFQDIIEDTDAIGDVAWKIFNIQSGKEASEDIKSLVYEGAKAPWGFSLLACVLYS